MVEFQDEALWDIIHLGRGFLNFSHFHALLVGGVWPEGIHSAKYTYCVFRTKAAVKLRGDAAQVSAARKTLNSLHT